MIDNSMNLVPYNEKNEIVKANKKIELTETQKRKISVILHFLFELLKSSILFCLLVFILRNPKGTFETVKLILGEAIYTILPVGLIFLAFSTLISKWVHNKYQYKNVPKGKNAGIFTLNNHRKSGW